MRTVIAPWGGGRRLEWRESIGAVYEHTIFRRSFGAMGLVGLSAAALAGEPTLKGSGTPAHPQEPVGFVTGGVIGALRSGPDRRGGGRRSRDLARQSRASRDARPTRLKRKLAMLQIDTTTAAGAELELAGRAGQPHGQQSGVERQLSDMSQERSRPHSRSTRMLRRCSMACRGMCCSGPAAPKSRRTWRTRSRLSRRRCPSRRN